MNLLLKMRQSSEIMVLFDSNWKYSSTANHLILFDRNHTQGKLILPLMPRFTLDDACMIATSSQLHRRFKEFSIDHFRTVS